MTEQEQFEEILRELGELLLQLGDLAWNVVLIGGQVLALESLRKGGSGVIAVTTDTGAVIERGYSHEPDLPLLLGDTSLRIRLPDAVGFLSMKVRAKLEQRPSETKDCFDIFAYIKLVGLADVRTALERAGPEGQVLRDKLQRLFWSADAAGVQDIIAYAGGLEEVDRALLAQAAVDLFADL